MNADKKKYYKLDEIGIVGTQEKVSAAQRKLDNERTAEIIRKEKACKSMPLPVRKRAS